MRVLVVDPEVERREALVHLICELPDVEVGGAVHGLAECRAVMTRESFDVIVAGELPLAELSSMVKIADMLGCSVVEVTSDEGLATTLARVSAYRERDTSPLNELVSRTSGITLGRDQTLELREWLPQALRRVRLLVPPYVEIVPIIADGTAPVRCVPEMLEHALLELVRQASRQLPWGGTVWVTASPGNDNQVKLDVLENGRGEVLDLVLAAASPCWS